MNSLLLRNFLTIPVPTNALPTNERPSFRPALPIWDALTITTFGGYRLFSTPVLLTQTPSPYFYTQRNHPTFESSMIRICLTTAAEQLSTHPPVDTCQWVDSGHQQPWNWDDLCKLRPTRVRLTFHCQHIHQLLRHTNWRARIVALETFVRIKTRTIPYPSNVWQIIHRVSTDKKNIHLGLLSSAASAWLSIHAMPACRCILSGFIRSALGNHSLLPCSMDVDDRITNISGGCMDPRYHGYMHPVAVGVIGPSIRYSNQARSIPVRPGLAPKRQTL